MFKSLKSSFTCPSSSESNTFLLDVTSNETGGDRKKSKNYIYAASDDKQQTFIEKRYKICSKFSCTFNFNCSFFTNFSYSVTFNFKLCGNDQSWNAVSDEKSFFQAVSKMVQRSHVCRFFWIRRPNIFSFSRKARRKQPRWWKKETCLNR